MEDTCAHMKSAFLFLFRVFMGRFAKESPKAPNKPPIVLTNCRIGNFAKSPLSL
jgi:hypothetical protein